MTEAQPKQKLTKEYFQKEIEHATSQIHRFSGVLDFCRWALENMEFEDKKPEAAG